MTATNLLEATQTALRVVDEVCSAVQRKSPLRIQGAGHWLDAGGPVEAEGVLSLSEDSGVLEYVPGDLTMTVLAGTPLHAINAAAAQGNQWLPLDPFGGMQGTIGATIATASYGPLAQMFGTPRDQLLGVEFVTGAGDIVRGGGKVTKNVAGFDLSRLCCGAWGTLGVLTEVTMRLRALPDREVTLAIPLAPGVPEVAQILERVRAANVTPAAMQLIDHKVCAWLGIELNAKSSGAVLLRFCGNQDGVEVQVSRTRAAFSVDEHPKTVWSALTGSAVEAADAMVVRLSSRPSQLPIIWKFAMSLVEKFGGTQVHASVGRGVVTCIIPVMWQGELGIALASRPPESSVIFEKLPPSLWPLLAPSEALSDRLSTRVRAAFDPHRILNRGILGEAAQ